MVELASIIILGILAQWLAWQIKVPAILPLIIVGLLVGPLSTLWTADSSKWIEPIFDPENNTGIFPGQYLFYFVSLSIGIILFEGGLTLKRSEIQNVGPAILKLITVGSLITFLGAGLITHYIMGLSWLISFLFAALIIVTGPTVIAPILQNVPLKRNISTVLKWEGILIDPIGALVAVLVFEFIVSGEGTLEFTAHAFKTFLIILCIGLALGSVAAYFLYLVIKRELIPHYLMNVFTLAIVLSAFVFSDVLAHESGLLTVVIMGMVLANLDIPELKGIIHFKESISILLISMLFILLAANINMEELSLLINLKILLLFGMIILVLRPIGVFLSTRASGLSFNEKLFVSWVGPRGIVAAGIASLFGIKLTAQGVPGAEFITPLVFMVVLGTVTLNATTARPLARILNVLQEASNGILFVGANHAARTIAQYLKSHGRHVVLLDSNLRYIKQCQEEGLECFATNIYTDDLTSKFELIDMGYLLAMTSNPVINEFACKKLEATFGENGTFRLAKDDELRAAGETKAGNLLFAPFNSYYTLDKVSKDYTLLHEIPIKSKEHFIYLIKSVIDSNNSIPLFIKRANGFFDVLQKNFQEIKIEEGDQMVYLGEVVDIEAEVNL